MIAFNSWHPMSHLFMLNAQDGAVKQLTQDSANEVEPSWSRDGKWIYCGSDRTGRFEIYRLPATGGSPVPITRQGGLHAEESADGKWIYYSKDYESPTAIWKTPHDGGDESLVLGGLSYSTNFVPAEEGIFLISAVQPSESTIEFYDFRSGRRTPIIKLDKPFSWGIALSRDESSLVYSVVITSQVI
jgi:Tol biopolymer transport system component